MTQLAINGGTAVRTKPFPKPYLGAALLGDEELALVTEVIRRQAPFRDYGMNPPHFVVDLENEARAYLGAEQALATSSCTGALHCALAALGVGRGDEVIIPAFAWWSNYTTVVLSGATPVFAEVDASLALDPEDFARRITPRTKAAMVIHFQGAPARMDAILEIADQHGVRVIEDVAQAAGGSYQGAKLGTLGAIGCFSFQQNKVITAGEGGMLVTNDPVLFERAVRYHDMGGVRKALAAQIPGGPTQPPMAGAHFRMSEVTAAIALAQWRKLDPQIIGPTRVIWSGLRTRLREACPGLTFRPCPDEAGDIGIALYMQLSSAPEAEKFRQALAAEGVPVGPSSSVLHLVRSELVQKRLTANAGSAPFGAGLAGEQTFFDAEGFPRTDEALARLACVPIVPAYTEEDVEDIFQAIHKVWAGLTQRSAPTPR